MKKDIRAEKSRILLRQALLQLLLKKEIHKITVNNICEEAQVGRSTFYNHYGDKTDLLEDTVAFYSKIANQTTYSAFVTDDHLDLHANLLRVYQTTIQYSNIIQALLSVHLPNADFETNVREMLSRKYKVLLENTPIKNCMPEDLATELYTANALTVTKYIAYHTDTVDIEQLADCMFGIYQTILAPVESVDTDKTDETDENSEEQE